MQEGHDYLPACTVSNIDAFNNALILIVQHYYACRPTTRYQSNALFYIGPHFRLIICMRKQERAIIPTATVTNLKGDGAYGNESGSY